MFFCLYTKTTQALRDDNLQSSLFWNNITKVMKGKKNKSLLTKGERKSSWNEGNQSHLERAKMFDVKVNYTMNQIQKGEQEADISPRAL